jgi:hypothetical protein
MRTFGKKVARLKFHKAMSVPSFLYGRETLFMKENDKVDSKQVKNAVSWNRRTDQERKYEDEEELKIINTRDDFYEELTLHGYQFATYHTENLLRDTSAKQRDKVFSDRQLGMRDCIM